MSKKKSISISKKVCIAGIIMGVVAILMIFLNGMNIIGLGDSDVASFTGLQATFGDENEGLNFSFLNLLSYILVVVAIVMLILTLVGVFKKKWINYISAALLVVGGILFFFTAQFAVLNDVIQSLIDLANSLKDSSVVFVPGYGSIIAGVLSVIAGLVVIGGTVKAKK